MIIVEVQEFLENQTWTFAKTMPESPHWYIVRSDTLDFNAFIEVVRFIQQNGLPSTFAGVTYNYLHLGEYKYWTMGLLPEETTIINRAFIKSTNHFN